MIIEMIGLPGAGKSYYTKEIYKVFKKSKKKIIFENKKKINFFLKVSLLIKFTIKKPLYIFLFLIFHHYNKSLDKTWKERHYRWILKEIIFYEYCKDSDIILIRSEGLHQRLLFYLATKIESNFNLLERLFLSYTPVPNKLVMIDISINESIKITSKRQKGFKFDKKTISMLPKQKKILKEIKNILIKSNKNNFIIIRSNKPKKYLNKYFNKLI